MMKKQKRVAPVTTKKPRTGSLQHQVHTHTCAQKSSATTDHHHTHTSTHKHTGTHTKHALCMRAYAQYTKRDDVRSHARRAITTTTAAPCARANEPPIGMHTYTYTRHQTAPLNVRVVLVVVRNIKAAPLIGLESVDAPVTCRP